MPRRKSQLQSPASASQGSWVKEDVKDYSLRQPWQATASSIDSIVLNEAGGLLVGFMAEGRFEPRPPHSNPMSSSTVEEEENKTMRVMAIQVAALGFPWLRVPILAPIMNISD